MLSLKTLELCPYPCMPWNCSRVLWKVIIFISFSKHNNCGLSFVFFNLDLYLLSFLDLKILPYPFKHCHFGPIFLTFDCLRYPSKHWNSDLILPNIRILTLFFHTLEFWYYPSKLCFFSLILSSTGIQVLSF